MLFLLVWFGALALGFLLLALSGISRPGPARAAAWAATVALTVSAGLTALTIGWLMVPAVVVAFAGIALASRRAARPADS
ncbi:MAG: hypothetical protein HY875_06095 [Chloroflexi bacterium]|nr:hypothetical protein [Chloroflexota bacterium]